MKKTRLKSYLTTGLLSFIFLFLLWNCENEPAGTFEAYPDAIATVSVGEAVSFFTVETTSKTTKTDKKDYIIPHLSQISQEDILNSDALVTVIPATTKYGNHYSRILLLKINNEIQSLVFSMYASDNINSQYFTGEILITSLQGNFLNGYRVENGRFVSQFRKKDTNTAAKTGNVVCPEHGECNGESDCILCLQELDEVEVTAEPGGAGEGIEIYPGLNDFPGIDEGGENGPDTGMAWDYGPGEGVAPEEEEENVEDQVVIDTTFANTPCLMAVYEQMGGSTTFENYLKNFDGSFSVADLRFSTDDNFANNFQDYINAMAITTPPITTNIINIVFNIDNNTPGNILEEPDIFKAVAMIHEVLHAEMYRKMLDAVRAAEMNQTTLNWTTWSSEEFYNNYLNSLENRYFGIFDYFTRYNYGVPTDENPNDWQHQQMAQHYRDIVKQSLTDYAPVLTEVQKDALSWIGLDSADIVAWQNLTPEEQIAIKNLQTQIRNTFLNACN